MPNPAGPFALTLRAPDGSLVPLSELVSVTRNERDRPIYHKDLLPVTYVVADQAGRIELSEGSLSALFEVLMRRGGEPALGAMVKISESRTRSAASSRKPT